MATDSNRRSAGTVANRLASLGAIIVGGAAFALLGLVGLSSANLAIWIAGLVAVALAAVAFAVIRQSVLPELTRKDESTGEHAARVEHLKTIENYRKEFLGDVSHELQTPIFAIQGFAETLLDGALEDSEVNRPFVDKILRHSIRLSALVQDLAHISEIETGSIKMDLATFDPRSLVNEAEESLERTARTAQVTLSKFVTPNVGLTIGDRPRILQVLNNLISNGIKYNDAGGRVEITVRRTEAGQVLFSVTDDGIGLSEEHFDRITERFYRVDKSRSRERGGTGLGLAIVKHILEAHGSNLVINSKIGRGSTFSFGLDSVPPHSTTNAS